MALGQEAENTGTSWIISYLIDPLYLICWWLLAKSHNLLERAVLPWKVINVAPIADLAK